MYGDSYNFIIGGLVALILLGCVAVFVGRTTGFIAVDYRCFEGVKQERWTVGGVPVDAWDKVGDNYLVACDD